MRTDSSWPIRSVSRAIVSSSFCTPWIAKKLVSSGTITSLAARSALNVSSPTFGAQSINAKS